MSKLPFVRRGILIVLGLALAGCAGTEPVRYANVAASPYMAANRSDDSRHVPYRFAAATEWRRYDKAIIEPVVIYHGADQQFGDLNDADKAALASYMQAQFADRLRGRFVLVTDPGPGTLRVHLTLTGAETSTPVLSTFTRFDIGGAVYNGVQAARGGEGMMTGSVSYAVEISDAASARLLSAFVAKQYPGAYNIGATMGSLAAAKVGIDKGADALLDELK
jgi:hypothetical protein